jgi:uncharacterized protein DUF6221
VAVDEMVTFIRARLDEIEHDAHACSDAPWELLPEARQVNISSAAIREEKWKYGQMTYYVASFEHVENARHVVRHDPARVLADVAMRRTMVSNLRTAIDHAWQFGEEAREVVAQLAVMMLQRLAALDADHPDYDPGWAL